MEALLFLMVLGAIYALSYVLNRHTPIPAGCEELTASCNGCAISSCELHPTQKVEGGIA